MASMQKVAWFNDIATFWQLWNTLPISHLERYFYDRENKTVPLYAVQNGENKRISTLAVFQSGIKPMWEDEYNEKGSEFKFVLQVNS